ncbi:MAG: Rieske 2Fe-2S domain-containing protein [Arenimonas sp.]|nr:Rieske 2Fe-2S domain-containing protein [Arenimonas sp.]
MESVNCLLISIVGLLDNQPMACNVLIDNQEKSIIVIKINGQIHTYLNQCPHQGRRMDYAPGQFLYKNKLLVCAAHGASFEMSSGLCLQGPCRGESLLEFACELMPDQQNLRVLTQPD